MKPTQHSMPDKPFYVLVNLSQASMVAGDTYAPVCGEEADVTTSLDGAIEHCVEYRAEFNNPDIRLFQLVPIADDAEAVKAKFAAARERLEMRNWIKDRESDGDLEGPRLVWLTATLTRRLGLIEINPDEKRDATLAAWQIEDCTLDELQRQTKVLAGVLRDLGYDVTEKE